MEEHPQARAIVQILAKAGFIAYYAGGWVRDFLLGHPSDDIDIATNAPPETIQALFPHTVPIGISFGIILVIMEGHPFEVATFRKDFDYKDARRPSRIEFATVIEDAKRRDFTINGMFYDPLKEEVLDFVEGKKDLKAKWIRAIGNPHERIQEDRLRMIRAARLSCRFQFEIEPETKKAIIAHAKELFPAVAIERVMQEFKKAKAFRKLAETLVNLHELHILEEIFPSLRSTSKEEIEKALEPTKKYPEKAPLIASLLPLFPSLSLDEGLLLCKRLKLSNEEGDFVTFLFKAKTLLSHAPPDLYTWAHFYAHPLSQMTLEILGCHVETKDRFSFFEEHEKRRGHLSSSIERIHKKEAVVTSNDLKEKGIVPGRRMGELLLEAEKISINEQIFDTNKVIKRILKK